MKEHHAAALYCEALEKLGFAVEKGICGIEPAFSGSYGAGHPVIGILGEFDALSGLSQKCGETSPAPVADGGNGHGCGHNMLGAGSLAAAAAVKAYLESTGKPGTVIFFGAPARRAARARRTWRAKGCGTGWMRR